MEWFMTPSYSYRRLVVLLVLIAIGLLGGVVINVVQAVSTKQNTTEVTIKTSDKTAAITISQSDTEAAAVGIGNAHIRLKPGSYYIEARAAGKRAGKTVRVTWDPSTVSLTLEDQTTPLTTQTNVSFSGFDNLTTDVGLTTTQVSNLKQLFFTYKKDSRAISITTDSIRFDAHNPDSTDPMFGFTASGFIDGTAYNAHVRYAGFDTVELTVTDPSTGAVLFSGTLPQASGD